MQRMIPLDTSKRRNRRLAVPSVETLLGVKKKMDQVQERLTGVPDALRPIFNEWKAAQR